MGIHENLIQSFTNFKNKYIGNIGNSTVAALLNNNATAINTLNSDLTTKLNSYITYEIKVESFTANAYQQYNFDSDDYLAFAIPTTGSYLTYEIHCSVNPTNRVYGVRNASTHDQTITVTVVHVKKQ